MADLALDQLALIDSFANLCSRDFELFQPDSGGSGQIQELAESPAQDRVGPELWQPGQNIIHHWNQLVGLAQLEQHLGMVEAKQCQVPGAAEAAEEFRGLGELAQGFVGMFQVKFRNRARPPYMAEQEILFPAFASGLGKKAARLFRKSLAPCIGAKALQGADSIAPLDTWQHAQSLIEAGV